MNRLFFYINNKGGGRTHGRIQGGENAELYCHVKLPSTGQVAVAESKGTRKMLQAASIRELNAVVMRQYTLTFSMKTARSMHRSLKVRFTQTQIYAV